MRKNCALLVAVALGAMVYSTSVHATDAVQGAGFLDMAKDAGFMEYIILLVSVAGFALALQAIVTMRTHLLRPPELANELINLVQEGNLDGAIESAQGDSSFLGVVAFATLSNAQYGKESMESAMTDAGEIETTKLMNRIGMLNLIAAIAPMLGLTGTTIGMILTFAVIAVKADAVTAADMAKGIAVALVCTFTGLMVAIPLLVIAYFLKSRVTQVVMEISNDCGELIRIITSGGETSSSGGEAAQ
ncbi:MAG: MotA/TolQ/ExbB proton channel family protein [Planctomycetota bacterium]